MMGCDSQLEHKQTCFSAKLESKHLTANLTATRAPQSLSSLALNGAHKSSLTSVTFQAGW